MRTIKPRLVVTIRWGQVQTLEAEGFDFGNVEVVVLDQDTEGADEGDLISVGARFFGFASRNLPASMTS